MKKHAVLATVMGLSGSLMAIEEASQAPKASVILSEKSDLNIKFINSFDAMRVSKAGQDATKDLDKKRKELTEDIQKEEQKITAAVNDFKSKSATLSQSAREKEEKSLRTMETNYKTKFEESKYDLELTMQKSTEALAKDVEKAAKIIAERDKLDAVVDAVTGRVIYAAEKVNVTDSIIKAMDIDYDVKIVQNKKTAKDAVAVAENKTGSAKKAETTVKA